jgi:hypothetical protein
LNDSFALFTGAVVGVTHPPGVVHAKVDPGSAPKIDKAIFQGRGSEVQNPPGTEPRVGGAWVLAVMLKEESQPLQVFVTVRVKVVCPVITALVTRDVGDTIATGGTEVQR